MWLTKIYNWIINIPKDKVMHFTLSFLISLVCCSIATKYTNNIWYGIGFSWIVTFIIGMGKEICDELRYHGSEAYDWLADVIGFLVATIYSIIFI
jgi:VanZ family protein